MIAPSTAFFLAERHAAGVRSNSRVAELGRRIAAMRPAVLATAAAVLAALGVEAVLAAPYVGRAITALSHAHLTWIAVALLAEFASMMSFARLQRVMLRSAGVRVRLRDAVTTVFAGNALALTLPGGSVASFAYTLRRMRAWGASAPLAAFSLAATGVLSTVSLALLAATGSAIAGDVSMIGLTVIEVVLTALLVAAVLFVLGRPALIGRIAHLGLRGWRLVRPGTSVGRNLDGMLAELGALHPSARTWARGLVFSGANWLTDLLCLLAACRAVGLSPPLGTVLLAYAVGMAAGSSIPLLPGGLGAVDAALVLTLIHGGVPATSATAAVLIYRAVSFGCTATAGWMVVAISSRRRPSAPAASSSPPVTRAHVPAEPPVRRSPEPVCR